jgi:protein-L-isoaspartate(D-aspartate) O-methyltransferase
VRFARPERLKPRNEEEGRMSLEDIRAFYARFVTAKGGSGGEALAQAFATVDRSAFVGSGPWKIHAGAGYVDTPTDDPAFIFHDVVIGLKPERGINNGEPSLHARCIAAVDPQPGETVLHAGAGTGYYSAILAELVGPEGRVEAYEVEADLAAIAQRLFEAQPNVRVHARSALEGRLEPVDIVYVSAGATRPPAEWLDALNPGGRLIFPLTAGHWAGVMMRVTRTGENAFAAKVVSAAAFIPCAGARSDAEGEAVMQALGRGGHAAVRSLRRDGEPDDTAWLSGDGWWFSTREP